MYILVHVFALLHHVLFILQATDDITVTYIAATAAAASAAVTASAATWAPEVTIRAQFRLPNGAKGMEKFSTTEDVRNVVRAAAKLVSLLSNSNFVNNCIVAWFACVNHA